MVAEARGSLSDATRMTDQPDNFKLAIKKVRDIVSEIKAADVLKVDVAQLESDIAIFEKTINKVTSLNPEDILQVYSFNKKIDSLPFALYAYDKKITLVTKTHILGPFVP